MRYSRAISRDDAEVRRQQAEATLRRVLNVAPHNRFSDIVLPEGDTPARHQPPRRRCKKR